MAPMKSTTTERFCKKCHRTKKLHLFYSSPIHTCKSCFKKTDAYQNQRDRYLYAKYGITVREYNLLLEHNLGRCWICKGKSGGKNLAVDHNHRDGLVRGLLCKRCNGILARMMDNVLLLESATQYLYQNGRAVLTVLGREAFVPPENDS